MSEYVVRRVPGENTTRVSRPGGVSRVRTRLAGGGGGGASLSDATPQAPGVASAGVATTSSRSDHVHPAQTSTAPDEVYVQASAPSAPTDAAHAVWYPIPAGLVSFVDFRSLPDGTLSSLLTETNGGGSADPLTLTETLSTFGVAGVIENGRLTHPTGSTPARNIPVIQPGPIGTTWRITYGHGGITERDTALTVGQQATLNITFTNPDGGGDGYILHASAFEKATAGMGSGNATYLAIGRDDAGVAVLSFTPPEIAVVAGDRMLESGDRVALASEGSNVYKGYLNGVEAVSFTDSTYDPALLGAITLPTNSLDGSTWRNGIEWIAVTTGADFDPDRDLLPPHRWNGTEWVPIADPIPAGIQERLVNIERDTRWTDARTPTAHAASHQDGGSDELALDASQLTGGTVATARLGTGTADATTFLRGDQTWATPAGGGGTWTVVSDLTLGVDTAQVDIVIPDAPSFVRVRIVGRSTDTGATVAANGQLRLNEDTTANLHVRSLASNYGGSSNSSGTVFLLGTVAASQTNTDRAALITLNVAKMSGGYPIVRGDNLSMGSTATDIGSPQNFHGVLADGTQEITDLSFLLSSGSWAAGSRFIVEAAA